MRHAIGSVVVAMFALVFLHGAWLLRLVDPVFSRYLALGLPGGPNVLLAVRGRSSGRTRRAPVAMLQLGQRRFLQAAFGEVGWVMNLRAAGQAVVTKGRDTDAFDAVELTPEIAAVVMHDALAACRPSRLVRAVVGPTVRPPVGILRYFGVRVDETLDDYIGDARRHPIFELVAPAVSPGPVVDTIRGHP